MCGIAGFIANKERSGAEAVLRRMTAAIVHRGPDDEGFYRDRFAALGHRRLSIIDVAGGHQPMCNEDGTVWIVYNGEIFNHAELRPELEKAGHRYATHCDTETILHAYEEYGAECMARFRGMFAFTIWDSRRRIALCVRDRLGIKPLYYRWDGSLLVFGSEIKALLAHPEVSAQLEESVLPEYLGFGFVGSEKTLYRGIRKLMPGHLMKVDFSGASPALELRQYWDVPEPEARGEESEAYWISETRRRLEETVQMRLMSDVPLGMFLSGGVDSSAIAALIRRMSSGPVKTFSVGYREAQYSELGYAAQVASAIGTEHREVRIGMEDFFDALPRLVWQEDEPVTWPSSVSLYFVSRLAAEDVKVVLTGEGSDELFGGYERYRWNLWNTRWARRYEAVPEGLRRTVREAIANSGLLKSSLRRKLSHTFLGRETALEPLFLDNFYCAFPAREAAHLLGGAQDGVYSQYRRYFDAREGRPLLSRMLYADQKTYLVELLMKQDQMSMAASIESRVPFLDHLFVAFAAEIPNRLKIRGTEQKYVFKRAVEDLLPREIVYRKKMGFPTPLRSWLLEPRAKPLLARLTSREGVLGEYFDLAVIGRLLERHAGGVEDATDRIWRLLNLQIWGDVFLTGRHGGAPPAPGLAAGMRGA